MMQINFDVLSDIGQKLQKARNNKGFSLEDVAKELKLSPQKIAAFESGEVTEMPMVYLRGHLLAYAKFLGILPQEIKFDLQKSDSVFIAEEKLHIDVEPLVASHNPSEKTIKRTSIKQQFLLLVILALLLIVIGWLRHEKKFESAAIMQKHSSASITSNLGDIKL